MLARRAACRWQGWECPWAARPPCLPVATGLGTRGVCELSSTGLPTQASVPARREVRIQPAGVMAGFGRAGAGDTNRKGTGLSFRCFCGLSTGGAGLWAKGVSGPVWRGPWHVVGVSPDSCQGCVWPPLRAPRTEQGSYRVLLRSPASLSVKGGSFEALEGIQP